jgi:hypothetical protein
MFSAYNHFIHSTLGDASPSPDTEKTGVMLMPTTLASQRSALPELVLILLRYLIESTDISKSASSNSNKHQ